MSADALNYQLNTYLGSNAPLLAYYDFNSSSVFSAQSGSVHQAYLNNVYPSCHTGNFYGKIIGATGTSSANALNLATGAGGFITSGEGNFRKNTIEISGSQNIPINSCSYMFSVEPDLSKDGVILGSFERISESVGGQEIVSSKGFKFGLTARGKPFLQSLSRDGEYCFVSDNIELSQKSVLGLSFNTSQVKFFRFDYLNDNIQSDEFSLDSSHIQNNSLFLGSSPNFYRSSGGNLFSGTMDEFVLFSGQIPENVLFEIGKGLVSEYSFTSGAVTSTQVLSGYVPTFVYKTGITGGYANITGYASVRSGLDEFVQSLAITGTVPVREGDRYYKNFGVYLEEQGFLSGAYSNTYSPTGDAASGTLGLQAGSTNVSGYSISNTFNQTNINIPLYQMVYLYGTTNELSGIVNTPVYTTVYTTGSDSSGVVFTGDMSKLQKDYIYFMGDR